MKNIAREIIEIIGLLLIVILLDSHSLAKTETKKTKKYNQHLMQHLLECKYGFDACKTLYKGCQPPIRRKNESKNSI